MKLYLIRHGQSETNFSRCHSGWAQVSLTEQGLEDARRAGQQLEGIHFDRIFSSDLKRAIQTAKTAVPGCEPEQLSLLREINVGRLERVAIVECQRRYGEIYDHHRAEQDYTCYGGENRTMLQARVAAFMKTMEAEDHGETIAVFCHEGIIRGMLGYIMGKDLTPRECKIANGAVSVLGWDGEVWSLQFWNRV